MAKWTKTSPWGNYLDPEQNYKNDLGKIIQESIITQARRMSKLGKHIGSKSLNVLKKHLNYK